MTDAVEAFAYLISNSQNIVALTGAGISTSAGIPDFRGPQGLYVTRQYDPDVIFNTQYFKKDPKPFFDFARDYINLEKTLKPTASHLFLSYLEKTGKLKGVITQNIDSLHQRAGSKKVLEMHGSFYTSHCQVCDRSFSYDELALTIQTQIAPICDCGGVIKPDIVFFGDQVKHFDEAADLAEASDLLLIIGTSCTVFPAANIPEFAGGKIVIINKGQFNLLLKNVVLHLREDSDDFFSQVHNSLFT